jgi:hypothetical protein
LIPGLARRHPLLRHEGGDSRDRRGGESGFDAFAHQAAGADVIGTIEARKVMILEGVALRLGHLVQ